MKILCAALMVTLLVVSAAVADIALPAPKKEGGHGIYDALEFRASARGDSFPSQKLSNEELSQILWAASGRNRGGRGWTVPFAMGTKPYCKIYVTVEDGVFLYDYENHDLKEVSNKDIRANMASQPFAKTSPCALIFVTDMDILKNTYNRDKELAYHFASVAAGAMTQNAYLAAASMNLGARYIYSMNRDFIHGELKISGNDSALCILLIGKYAL